MPPQAPIPGAPLSAGVCFDVKIGQDGPFPEIPPEILPGLKAGKNILQIGHRWKHRDTIAAQAYFGDRGSWFGFQVSGIGFRVSGLHRGSNDVRASALAFMA